MLTPRFGLRFSPGLGRTSLCVGLGAGATTLSARATLGALQTAMPFTSGNPRKLETNGYDIVKGSKSCDEANTHANQ